MRTYFSHFSRWLAGLVFIASAILKFLSVDIFELYIYSWGAFSFNISALLARLVISTELLLGLLLITGIYFRRVFYVTIGLLVVFSAFLVYRQFNGGANENCNCFGDYIRFTPLESLLKNAVLLVMLFFTRKFRGFEFRFKAWAAATLAVCSIALPLILSAPDFFFHWQKTDTDIDRSSQLIAENEILQQNHVGDGKKIVCFFSVTCPYCELAAKKISILSEQHHLEDSIFYVLAGSEKDLPLFWEKSGSIHFSYTFLDVREFFRIAGPIVPSIFLSDNGKIIAQYNYRDIDEQEIAGFFSD